MISYTALDCTVYCNVRCVCTCILLYLFWMYVVSCYFHTPISAQSEEKHMSLISVSGGLLTRLQMTCNNYDDFSNHVYLIINNEAILV